MSIAVTEAKHTLHKPYAAMYVSMIEQATTSATQLLTLFQRRRTDSAEREAIFHGYCALKKEAEELVIAARERGLLLFVGQPVAINAARLMERQRRAAC